MCFNPFSLFNHNTIKKVLFENKKLQGSVFWQNIQSKLTPNTKRYSNHCKIQPILGKINEKQTQPDSL
jgi:hypothetical protein